MSPEQICNRIISDCGLLTKALIDGREWRAASDVINVAQVLGRTVNDGSHSALSASKAMSGGWHQKPPA